MRVHRRCLDQSNTVNQVNALHIALENRMTPAERKMVIKSLQMRVRRSSRSSVRGLLPSMQFRYPQPRFDRFEAASFWLQQFDRHQKLSGSDAGTDYLRAPLGQGAYLFRHPFRTHRKLLVGWPGMANRLMMPVANWIPTLERLGMDLILFRRPGVRRRELQLAWNRNSIPTAHKLISELRERCAYESVAVVGTSMGAVPALRYSLEAHSHKTSLVGLESRGWQGLDTSAHLEGGLDLALSRDCFREEKRFFTYGMDAPGDRKVAMDAQTVFGGETIGVPQAGHGPIWALFERRGFEGWFIRTLG